MICHFPQSLYRLCYASIDVIYGWCCAYQSSYSMKITCKHCAFNRHKIQIMQSNAKFPPQLDSFKRQMKSQNHIHLLTINLTKLRHYLNPPIYHVLPFRFPFISVAQLGLVIFYSIHLVHLVLNCVKQCFF